jgi:hypothetical protein
LPIEKGRWSNIPKNWSNNVCFILCFSHSMLLKVCVCHMLEKPVSFNIFSKHFIHLISKFCCEYKWCDKLVKFCIMILNLKTSTPNYMIYGELGRYPFEIDIKIRIISFWAKIICGKQSKISFVLYFVLATRCFWKFAFAIY